DDSAMGVIRATRCIRCGRDVRGLPEARKEGGLRFCSQSCYLQHVSTATHAGPYARNDVASYPARGAVGGIRLIGKTIKWALILVALAAVALVVAALVGLGRTADKSASSSRRATVAFR